MQDLQERLLALETRQAYQERMVDELNQVVTECNGRIRELEGDLRALRRRLARLSEPGTSAIPTAMPDS
ncbi:SlyX family protein [Geoalkalibacter halelectricus]|uniref:SlyX family protein n=1 Tax=Geoalkalibacter halelectricus TaxID=2847045 RepID=A0ABY5ZP11_9BACT|nr:SlyX family protein [Geoalkalibacter halelectricus]MDO3377353.1 SlyX family protein [Geoalkalibacter halelectricus]UWZ80882.1 SlyX family protein [Geoalkalibacter halelectricus]